MSRAITSPVTWSRRWTFAFGSTRRPGTRATAEVSVLPAPHGGAPKTTVTFMVPRSAMRSSTVKRTSIPRVSPAGSVTPGPEMSNSPRSMGIGAWVRTSAARFATGPRPALVTLSAGTAVSPTR